MADDELVAFAKQLAPQPFDRSTVSERRNSIEEHIKKHTSSAGLVESGSWSHGTAVTGHSDVDYMAFFPDSSRPVRPSTALTNLKQSLATQTYERFMRTHFLTMGYLSKDGRHLINPDLIQVKLMVFSQYSNHYQPR